MDYKKVYEEWLNSPYFDEETKAELRGIARDENEIRERFYAELEFGTCLLYTSPSPRDGATSRMPSSA